jgi:hypothetical protein
MIKEINIMPRRSGKTTQLIKRFMDELDKGNGCKYICVNGDMAKYVVREINEKYDLWLKKDLVLSAVSDISSDKFRGLKDVSLYVDDYLLMSKSIKSYLRDFVNKQQINFISNTTSDILYEKELIELAKTIKNNPSCHFDDHIDSNTMIRIYEKYFHTLLTDPDCKIISDFEDVNRRMPPEVFKTEYMGLFLK